MHHWLLASASTNVGSVGPVCARSVQLTGVSARSPSE
jgi:hypothetical protein